MQTNETLQTPATVGQLRRQANVDPDDSIDLFQTLKLISQRKWALLSLALLVGMLSALYALSLTPVYRATVNMVIDPPKVSSDSLDSFFGGMRRNQEYFETQYALFKSRELMERIAINQNLEKHPHFRNVLAEKNKVSAFSRLQTELSNRLQFLSFRSPETIDAGEDKDEFSNIDEMEERVSTEDSANVDPEETLNYIVAALTSGVTVRPVEGTRLVNISMDMTDPKAAAEIANAIAQGYIESQLEARIQVTQSATSWMNTRVAELRQKLQESEKALQEYKEQENLVDIKGVTTLSAEVLSTSNSRLEDARKEAALLKSQISQIRAINSADLERLASVPAIMTDIIVQNFTSELAKAKAKRAELARRYGPKHPKMITAEAELQSAAQNLSEQIRQVRASLEQRYQLANANVASLQRAFKTNTGAIQDVSRKQYKFREYQREVETNRALYESFLARLKEASATADIDAANARIVDRALVPRKAIKPNKRLIVGIAVLLALLTGVVLIVLQDLLDNKFKTPEQLEDALNLPVIGSIPLAKKYAKKLRELSHLFLSGDDKHFSEAIRALRTTLMLTKSEADQQIIMVTSSIPSEGKSSVAANLALAMGQMKSVLLIDGDLRRPKVAAAFGQSPGLPGLANLIAGNADLEECLVDIDGISILTTGATPPNPLELLSSAKFDELLEILKEKYEIIIIDTPPVQAVSDPLVIARNADHLIYVVKADHTHRDLVEGGVGKILQHNIRINGIVLNQLDAKKASYYSYRYGAKYNEYYA